ncbi:uncharacterized protein LOC144098059 [Amblyomma americanum]
MASQANLKATLVHGCHNVLTHCKGLHELPRSGQGSCAHELMAGPHFLDEASRDPLTNVSSEGGYDHESLAAGIRTEISMATRTILKEMAFLKAQNEVIISLFGQGEVDVEEPAQYSYPLMTVNDVEEVEKSLKNSEAARKQLRKVLSHIGGTTVRNTTANMLKHLLHDSVGVNYSLYGQKGKKALVSMELFKVIVQSVRKNPDTHSASDMDARSAVMAWLKNCQARLNTTTKR